MINTILICGVGVLIALFFYVCYRLGKKLWTAIPKGFQTKFVMGLVTAALLVVAALLTGMTTYVLGVIGVALLEAIGIPIPFISL